MTGAIIPLRSGHDATPALAHFDVAAAKLLSEGRAASLSMARVDAMLAELRVKRAELVAVLADLQARPPSGDDWIDSVNADLSVEAGKGLAQIDVVIQHIQAHSVVAEQAEPPQPPARPHRSGASRA